MVQFVSIVVVWCVSVEGGYLWVRTVGGGFLEEAEPQLGFKDKLDLNWLQVLEEASLSGRGKTSISKWEYLACEAPWAVQSNLCM